MPRRLWAALSLALLWSTGAEAAPDLKTLLDAAAKGVDVAVQLRAEEEARINQTGAGLRLAPSVAVTGGYTRNQYEVTVDIPNGSDPTNVRTATITPKDQLDLKVTATIPLIDVGAWMRIGAAKAQSQVAMASTDDTSLTVAREVVSGWYQLLSADALRDAAASAKAAAASDLQLATARKDAGRATALDVARAESAVARADQQVADADRAVRDASRTLTRRTGLAVSSDDLPALSHDDQAEPDLDSWLRSIDKVPSVQASDARVEAARAEARAAGAVFAPTVSGQVGERVTNAAGFGPSAAWSAGVNLTWNLAPGSGADASAKVAAVRTAEARATVARQDAESAVTAAFDRVTALRARTAAARAEAAASTAAVAEARARQAAGTATLTEVLDAERDRMSAVASELQAWGDLAAARADLRLVAGRQEEL